MSDDRDDFDRRIRATLNRQSERAPRVDLSAGALRQARRIRTRRRIAGGVTLAAVAAIAIPVGAQVLEESPPETAATDRPPTDVELSGLTQAATPEVPYIHGDEFSTPDGETTRLEPVKGRITDAVRLSDGVLVWHLDERSGRLAYSANGSRPSWPVGTSGSAPAVDSSAGQAAWAFSSSENAGGNGNDKVVITHDLKRAVIATPTTGEISQVIGVHDGTVLYNGRSSSGDRFAEMYRPEDSDPAGDGTESVPAGGGGLSLALEYATAIDPGFTRIAAHSADMPGGAADCTAVYDLESAAELWRSCDWRPVEFSADSSLVLAIRPDVDGLGPRELGVLDASDGTIRRVFSTEGTFGRATFEGSTSMVSVLLDGDRSAIVRCGIDDGDCELATEPRQVAPDDPASLTSPYQLTAN